MRDHVCHPGRPTRRLPVDQRQLPRRDSSRGVRVVGPVQSAWCLSPFHLPPMSIVVLPARLGMRGAFCLPTLTNPSLRDAGLARRLARPNSRFPRSHTTPQQQAPSWGRSVALAVLRRRGRLAVGPSGHGALPRQPPPPVSKYRAACSRRGRSPPPPTATPQPPCSWPCSLV